MARIFVGKTNAKDVNGKSHNNPTYSKDIDIAILANIISALCVCIFFVGFMLAPAKYKLLSIRIYSQWK